MNPCLSTTWAAFWLGFSYASRLNSAGRREAGQRGHIPVKIVVAYEGKAEVASGRRTLVERRVMAGVAGAQAFTEQAFAQMFGHWDYGSVKECHLGGDGAQWIKAGCEYFPGAVYHLDPYHLHKALLEGLRHDDDAYEDVPDRTGRA